MTDEQWGPWIEHDGKGCPVQDGVLVQVLWIATSSGDKYKSGQQGVTQGVVNRVIRSHPAWDWSNEQKVAEYKGKKGRVDGRFVRYRVRRPRSLTVLQEIAAHPDRVIEPAEVGG